MELKSIATWLAVAAVAAVAAGISYFTKLGNPLYVGLGMILAGVVIAHFLKGKNVGLLSAVPKGLIVAGGIVLAQKYVVPYFNKVTGAA